jgi:hypothetical protein
MSSNNISASSCFLFLLNIIVGTGVFLNTAQLFFLLNKGSYLAYLVTGFLMIPIITITYFLANDHPGCNLTVLFSIYFGGWNKVLVPLYALSKFATSVIGIIFISTLLKNMFFNNSMGYGFNLLFFLLIYLLCVILVYYDISINYIIQKIIITVKLIPLIAIILFFVFYVFYDSILSIPTGSFASLNLVNENFCWLKLAQGASITIFAFSGFESLFAINHLLIGNKKRGALLLGLSFLSAWCLYILYQFSIGNLAHFFFVDTVQAISFSSFLQQCFGHVFFANIFILFINIAIMVSSFGVAHGIMYVTVNNLYSSLVHVFGNLKNTKFFVFALIPLYALAGMRNIFILQQFSSLGTIITYGIFVCVYYKSKDMNKALCFFGVLSILIFICAHLYNAIYYFGFLGYAIYIFCFLLLLFLNFFVRGF